jgi:hypothetical protein
MYHRMAICQGVLPLAEEIIRLRIAIGEPLTFHTAVSEKAEMQNLSTDSGFQFYHRISKKKGNSKTAVTASKLLKIVYWIMKEKRTYNKSM